MFYLIQVRELFSAYGQWLFIPVTNRKFKTNKLVYFEINKHWFEVKKFLVKCFWKKNKIQKHPKTFSPQSVHEMTPYKQFWIQKPIGFINYFRNNEDIFNQAAKWKKEEKKKNNCRKCLSHAEQEKIEWAPFSMQ